MYYIRNVKKTNIDAVRNYLLDVPTIKKVDEEILKKAVFISKMMKYMVLLAMKLSKITL